MKKILPFLLVIFILSCRNEDKNLTELPLIRLKIEKPNFSSLQPLRLSEFVDSIEYVQLETTNESLMTYIGTQAISPVDNFLLFNTLFSVLQFDATSGKFMRSIGQKGQGPEEYTVVHNLCCDKENQNIIIKGGGKQHFMMFDYEGIFKGDLPLSDSLLANCFYSLSLVDIDNQYMIFAAEIMPAEQACQPYELIVYDYENDKVIHALQNQMGGRYERHSAMITGMRTSTKHDGNFYLKTYYNDTLYVVHKEKGINPYAIIDLGNRKLPVEVFFSKASQPDVTGKLLLNGIYINHECILLSFCMNMDNSFRDVHGFICKYDMNSGNLTYHSPYIANDIDGGIAVVEIHSLSIGIEYVYPMDMMDENTEKLVFSTFDDSDLKYPELKKRFEQMQNKRNPEDNPLLMKLYKRHNNKTIIQ